MDEEVKEIFPIKPMVSFRSARKLNSDFVPVEIYLVERKAEVYWESVFFTEIHYYHKYPNLVRAQVETISDPNYLVRILFEW